jgi:hypothetical protein
LTIGDQVLGHNRRRSQPSTIFKIWYQLPGPLQVQTGSVKVSAAHRQQGRSQSDLSAVVRHPGEGQSFTDCTVGVRMSSDSEETSSHCAGVEGRQVRLPAVQALPKRGLLDLKSLGDAASKQQVAPSGDSGGRDLA